MSKINVQEGIENVILPQRFVPFDIGQHIDVKNETSIRDYLLNKGFIIKDISNVLKSITSDVVVLVEIIPTLKLYIFENGIGVFVFEDDWFPMGKKYAVDYCEYRRNAHNQILKSEYGKFSILFAEISNDLRRIVETKKNINRPSADSTWEHNGFSYVMTVSYIFKKDKTRKDYSLLSDLEKKNLQIMLQPSIANKEDSMGVELSQKINEKFDTYNFEVEKFDTPYNWIKSDDCSIYISWAAVVVFIRDYFVKYIELMEYLEADLQAMWLYTYCQYLNIKQRTQNNEISLAELKREKYYFQKKCNEFKRNDDSSIPVYLDEIRKELFRTSGIDNEMNNYLEYLDFCIDEIETKENEKQKKFSFLNEILLFIIAYIQIAPMAYDFLTGNISSFKPFPVATLLLVGIVGVLLIYRKDK